MASRRSGRPLGTGHDRGRRRRGRGSLVGLPVRVDPARGATLGKRRLVVMANSVGSPFEILRFGERKIVLGIR